MKRTSLASSNIENLLFRFRDLFNLWSLANQKTFHNQSEIPRWQIAEEHRNFTISEKYFKVVVARIG
jgi:hypothetical protein